MYDIIKKRASDTSGDRRLASVIIVVQYFYIFLLHFGLVTYIGIEELGVPVKRIDDLPSGQDGDVDGQQNTHHHE